MPDRQARRRTGARQPDKMLGGNIRNEQRSANGEPTDVAPRQKVFFGTAALFREIKAEAKNNEEVDDDDCNIYWRQNPVRNRHRRCKQHPFLLTTFGYQLNRAKSLLFVAALAGRRGRI